LAAIYPWIPTWRNQGKGDIACIIPGKEENSRFQPKIKPAGFIDSNGNALLTGGL